MTALITRHPGPPPPSSRPGGAPPRHPRQAKRGKGKERAARTAPGSPSLGPSVLAGDDSEWPEKANHPGRARESRDRVPESAPSPLLLPQDPGRGLLVGHQHVDHAEAQRAPERGHLVHASGRDDHRLDGPEIL